MKYVFLLIACLSLNHNLFSWTTPTPVTSNGITTWTGMGLNWDAVAGSQNYQLQVDTSNNFNSPLLYNKIEVYISSSDNNADTYESLEDLYFGKAYYWRVRAWVPGDTSAWSTVRTFTTRDYVTKDTPTDQSSQWTGDLFNWDAHEGVDFYEFQLDTTLSFNSSVLQTHQETYQTNYDHNSDTKEYFENLYFGTVYYWRVRAINAVDTSGWGSVWSFTTRDYVTKDTPTDQSSQWTGDLFDWDAHEGVDFYEFQLDTTLSFNSSVLQTHQETYQTNYDHNSDTKEYFDDLYFGTVYYWRVRAINAVDTSGWGSVWSFTTRDYVTKVSPSNGDLEWTGLDFNWDAHEGVDFYEFQLDTTLSFNSSALQTHQETYQTNYDHNSDTKEYFEDLYFGTVYYWRVRAINAVDTSDWGTVRNFTTFDEVALNSPADQAIEATGVLFDWDAHEGVDFYQFQLDSTSLFNSPHFQTHQETYINASDGNADTEQLYVDLYFGTVYYWRVRAINAVDTSAWSTLRSFTTINTIALTAPADQSDQWTGLTLDWAPHLRADFYELQLDTSLAFNSPAFRTHQEVYLTNADGFGDTEEHYENLYFGTTYYWRVRVLNAVDTSGWSSVWSFTTYDHINLDSPMDMAVNVPVAGVGLDWDSHHYVDYYEAEWDTTNLFNSPLLQYKLEGYTGTANNSGSTYHPTGALLANQTYHWRVRAVNAVDTSEWRSRVFSTGNNIPNPEVPMLIAPANGANFINNPVTFDWGDAANALEYELQYGTDQTFGTTTMQSTVSSGYTTSGLTIDDTYYWRVRSINGGYYSAWSDVWSFSTDTFICSASFGNISPTSCDSYTSPSGLYQWTATGTYSDTISNINGCDSIVTVNLTIYNSNSGSEIVTVCDDYTWPANGVNYTTGGTYTATLTNALGCDSVVTLNLTIQNSNSGSETVTVCDSYTWSANGVNYTSGGTYTATLTNALGCDSVVTLNLTIQNSNSGSETVTVCDSYTWSANGVSYTSGGTYTATLTNALGCDSVVTLNLTIQNSNSGNETVTVCDSYTWSANGVNYTSGGTYTATLTNALGCDSVVTLNLTIQNSNSGNETVTVCDSYTWSANGVNYTSGGTYTAMLTNVLGCDSVATLHLTINHSNQVDEMITACDAYTWPVNGVTYTTSGTYNASYTNALGCDSIHTLVLNISQADTTVTQNGTTLTANQVGATYQWLDCDNGYAPITGETNSTFVIPDNGNYAVEVSINGCVDTSACYSDGSVGIVEQSFGSNFNAYPNPTRDGRLVMHFGVVLEEVYVTVYNGLGQEVMKSTVRNTDQTIIHLDEAPGVYSIELRNTAGKRVYVKAIKQ